MYALYFYVWFCLLVFNDMVLRIVLLIIWSTTICPFQYQPSHKLTLIWKKFLLMTLKIVPTADSCHHVSIKVLRRIVLFITCILSRICIKLTFFLKSLIYRILQKLSDLMYLLQLGCNVMKNFIWNNFHWDHCRCLRGSPLTQDEGSNLPLFVTNRDLICQIHQDNAKKWISND